jgi:hypothetical protein
LKEVEKFLDNINFYSKSSFKAAAKGASPGRQKRRMSVSGNASIGWIGGTNNTGPIKGPTSKPNIPFEYNRLFEEM